MLEHGHALLGAGRCLIASDPADATRALTAANALFMQLGAAPLIEETESLLSVAA